MHVHAGGFLYFAGLCLVYLLGAAYGLPEICVYPITGALYVPLKHKAVQLL